MSKKVYELVLWIAGTKIELGYFLTNREAKEALSLVKKHFAYNDAKLQDMIHDKDAGYEIIAHNVGFNNGVESIIRYNMEDCL